MSTSSIPRPSCGQLMAQSWPLVSIGTTWWNFQAAASIGATAVSFDGESLLHHRQLQPFLLFMLQTLHKARHQLPLLPLVYMPQHSLHHAAVIAIGSRTSRLMWNPHADNLLPDLWLLLLVMHFIAVVFLCFFFDQIKMSFISEGGWCIHNVLPVVRIAFSTRVCTHTSTHMHHGFLPVPCSEQEVFVVVVVVWLYLKWSSKTGLNLMTMVPLIIREKKNI